MNLLLTISFYVFMVIIFLIFIGIGFQIKTLLSLYLKLSLNPKINLNPKFGEYNLLNGKISTDSVPLRAPLSKNSCVYYKTFIEELRAKQFPKTIFDNEEIIPFSITSDEYSLYIKATLPLDESNLNLFVDQFKKTISYFSKSDENLRQLLDKIKIDVSEYETMTKNLSIYETKLLVGKDIFILVLLEKSDFSSNTFEVNLKSNPIYISETIFDLKTNVFDEILVIFGLFLAVLIFGFGIAYIISL
jgi:hypothetical protein